MPNLKHRPDFEPSMDWVLLKESVHIVMKFDCKSIQWSLKMVTNLIDNYWDHASAALSLFS